MEYLWVKWVHILSSTILFGTGVGSAFYMFMANRRGEMAGMYFAVRHVVIADWLFTTPAVVVQLLTGLWLAYAGGFPLTEGWVMWGLLLYGFAGLCWLPVVWMQIQMRDMLRQAIVTGQPLPARYWRMDQGWILLGSLAFPAVVAVFYLMVLKP